MPDWSYHPLKKIVLNKLEAKKSRLFIHRSMRTVASLPGGKHLIEFLGHNQTSSLLHITINNTNFKSPIGLSGSLDPELTGMAAFQELGFGFLEIGPVVFREPSIQIPPRWQQNRISFSHSGEKVSLKKALQLVTTENFHVPLFARLDENLCAVGLHRCIEQLSPFVDGFFLYAEQLEQLHEETGVSIYQIIPSSKFKNNIRLAKNVHGVVIEVPYLTTEDYSIEQIDGLHTLKEAVQIIKKNYSDLPIITNGGINCPSDAVILQEAGADLMMLTEGYVTAGPGLPKRIHERFLYNIVQKVPSRQWHWSFLFGLAIFIGGLIALYFALTTVILQYDEKFIGLTREQLELVNPKILAFMAHDRMSLAGTMISAGILYMALAFFGIRRQLHWAKIAFHSAAVTGFLGILLFIGYGYFDWLHGLFWVILLPIYTLSWRECKKLTGSPHSWHETNNQVWMRGVYGQLLFVIMGFSLLIGGFVISFIGITKVFVTTDISFLCMPAEMLQSISDMLIPVIAHDRAGFGSALISVGILVLCLALWGFRAGERWLWLIYAFGALPSFLAGIGTHFAIGYTNFIHLLPLYFLVVLYLLGLVLSYPYLMQQKNQ
ncbi:dihydroorotate dehydrogenase [Solibacillus silvestris]|uniref:dihydroorotate dehydrogenase n=1 Tax=Solibacillus silvestris TaxID=76853 RepID=UPI003F7DD797